MLPFPNDTDDAVRPKRANEITVAVEDGFCSIGL
jgi:hypothetical protein